MDLFKPDIFSKSKPKWKELKQDLKNELDPLISQIVPLGSSNDFVIEYSGSIEINSSNFRITFSNKKFVLKKWPPQKTPESIKKIEKIILFLKEKGIPVPNTIPFDSGQKILDWKNSLWTCSEFISGEYFSGKENQLKEMSALTAKTANSLYHLPKMIYPENKIRAIGSVSILIGIVILWIIRK